jgi:hypothetical protein
MLPILWKKLLTQFAIFLNGRKAHKQFVHDAMKSSEPAFARIWDNEEDAVYDGL